jgi:hypothetical protein
MAVNAYKVKTKEGKKKSLFSLLQSAVGLENIFENGLPVRYLPYIFFLTGMGIFYIGNSHYTEKTIRKIDKMQVEVEDLRADFTTLKSDYMFASKQSEVAKKVRAMGLIESSIPPFKIEVGKKEYRFE